MTAFDLSQSQINLSQEQKRAILARLLREKAKTSKFYHPLSYGQQALWFLYQNAPESSAYNTAFPVRIHSDVNVPALKSAFQKLIARHPCLRTIFTIRNGEPVQEVHGYQEVYFQETDASAWSWEELTGKVVEAYQRPFDLAKGPLLRVNLFTRAARDRVLLLTIHHIVTDGWSLWVLLEELRKLYSAQNSGTLAFLPPLTKSYSDYVNWHREMLTSQGEALWNYWQKKLAGDLPMLNLPTDRPRPPVQTYQGASHAFQLTEKLTQKLKKLAQSEGATLYMTLLAVFQVLLYRHTGQEDILVGSPTAGRNQSEFGGIVGYFVNPVVLRGNLAGNPTFKDFLNQLRQTVLDAIAHQDYPFPLIVERLQPNRDLSRSPIFQALFVLQRPQSKQLSDLMTSSDKGVRIDWGGLELEFLTIPTEEGQFDLTLEIVEGKKSLAGFFKYDTNLFDAQTISQMTKHFQTLLEAIVANPEQPISEFPLLTAAEKNQLLVEWNDTKSEYSHSECIHQLFEARVEQTPDAVAVVFQDRQLTYRELNIRANQLAHFLQSLEVGPDTLVGIFTDRSLEMVVGLLGILKAGGAYVPLDPAYPKERLTSILSDARLSVLLTTEKLATQLPEHQARIVCLDRDWEKISHQSQENPMGKAKPTNLAYLLYTSGSTGKPKGVAIEHRSPVALLNWAREVFTPKQLAGVLASTSICFDLSVFELFVPLSWGGKVILAENALELPILPAANEVTLINTVPSAIAELIRVNGIPTSVQTVNLAGEPLQNELVQQIYQLETIKQVFNLYGPSEDTTYSTFALVEKGASNSPTIGRPIANTQTYILDANLQPLPIGIPGELYIGGSGLARGYLNRPKLTAEKFITNPFSQEKEARLYKTGDLVRYLPDGNIQFLSRLDHQVKIRGFRIELGEIEAVLVQHPKVRETVVIARDVKPGDKHLVAYVVSFQETPASNELRRFLKEQLPDYMVPSAFVALDGLPLTPNGKVNRRALPAPERARRDGEVSLVPPRDALEWQLLEIWEEVLNVYPIGVRDDFFALGGHSLLAVRLMAKIQQQFDQNIPLAALFQNSTIEQLAELLRQQSDSSSWSPLVTIQPGGTKPPLFCLPGAGGNVIYFYELARHLGEDQPVYGLQAVGLDGEAQPLNCIEELAAHYREILQNVQPEGPYFLSGHSSGGLVAFEMAQQLHERGQEVGLVAILDSEAPVPDRPSIGVDWDNARWLTRIASIIERFLDKNLDVSYDALRLLEPDKQFNYIGERLKMSDLLPPEAGIKRVRGLLQVFKANYQASARYLPREVYPTPIAVFRATEINSEDTGSEVSSQLQQEPTWGWNQVSVEPVDLHVVPGDHITMFADPHVRVLAEKLRICLDRSQDY